MTLGTMQDKLHFTYNGKSSRDFKIINVSLSNSFFEETFVANKTLNTVYSNNRRTSLYSGYKLEPLEFDMTLAFENSWDDTILTNVVNWLYQDSDYYKPLIFEGNEDRIYYCMPAGTSNIHHVGTNVGYITLRMMTNSPYVFGNVSLIPLKNAVKAIINNKGLNNPETKIILTSSVNGEIVIKKGVNTVKITNVKLGEIITMYPEDEDIVSSMPGRYLYGSVYGDMSNLCLSSGNNDFTITGISSASVQFQPYYLR